MAEQNESEVRRLPPPVQVESFNCGLFILVAGIFPLIVLWLIPRYEPLENGAPMVGGLFIGLIMMFLLMVQIGAFSVGLTNFILIVFKKKRATRFQMGFALTGMICSLIYVCLLFMPRYLEARERKLLPGEYRSWFPWVIATLDRYQTRHGEYPPALMPYLVPSFWEHESAFPPDDYHKPRIQRYFHMNYSPHQWLDNGTTMSAEVTPKDFDFTGYYRYYSDGKGYILIGNGPDYDADLDAKESFLAARRGDQHKLIINKYDPTNGMDSGGDYYVLKLR